MSIEKQACIFVRLNNAFEDNLVIEASACSIDNNWYTFTMKSDGILQHTEYEMNIVIRFAMMI